MRSPTLLGGLASLLALGVARTDEFTDLAASFGTTRTLAGQLVAETNNPDGTAINFWNAAYEGAPASSVILSNPHMAAADALGNVYIADKASHSILRIDSTGLLRTHSGTHVAGFNGDGPASATSLQIDNPNGLFALADGTLYLLDPGNHRIRKVDRAGVMTTVVNDSDPQWNPSGRGLWVSPAEDLLYYSHEVGAPGSAAGAKVKKWTPGGGIEVVCNVATGFVNPGNLAVNPADGKLYVTDRAEDDASQLATGLFRIDGPNLRTRVLGNAQQPVAADGQSALNSYIEQTRGIAFLPNGAYFVCGHKDGSVWFVDTSGIMHKYLRGLGKKDFYSLPDGAHPPLLAADYFRQPRALTLAPNGALLVVSNDSGFVFTVNRTAPPHLPTDLRLAPPGSLVWTGATATSYVVERATSLTALDWQIIGAVTTPGGWTAYTDAEAGGLSQAFYRLSSPR